MVHMVMEAVGKIYAGPVPVRALREVSVVIEQGDYIAIEGPSGSGKSTLLNQIALLDVPTNGEYLIDGRPTRSLRDAERARLRSQTFGFIFQSFYLMESRTVEDNVALATLYRALPERRRRQRAAEALRFVGLEHKTGKKASLLSGGERQRVAIARAIASGAPVVVADEPTGNLDQATGHQVVDTLERLNERGTTVIIVTHDPGVAARARRRLKVLDGRVTETTSEITVQQHHSDALGLSGTTVPEELPPREETSDHQTVEGSPSTTRLGDVIADAWKGLWSRPARTLALVVAVALGVGLVLTTTGLSQTARYQVSDIFDAQRNQRVAMSAAQGNGTISDLDAVSPQSRVRLGALAGVQSVLVFSNHGSVGVTTMPVGRSTSRREGASYYDIAGVVDGVLPKEIVSIGSPGELASTLAPGEVLLGSQVAADLNLGPLLAAPYVWVDGTPRRVVGVVDSAGLQVGLLNSVIMRQDEAADIGPAIYVNVEVKVVPGAAGQVARQAPIAWMPAAADAVTVDAPPDPMSLREQIESNLVTMLLTLTGVALLAGVLSLTNATNAAVQQRIGEFGLRRAIGARRAHITSLVLTESLAVGLLGGALGVYGAMLLTLAVTIARHWQPVMSPLMIPVGFAGGVLVGLLGGLVATRRASHIEPSDALRAA